jgi:hypothetical protein
MNMAGLMQVLESYLKCNVFINDIVRISCGHHTAVISYEKHSNKLGEDRPVIEPYSNGKQGRQKIVC